MDLHSETETDSDSSTCGLNTGVNTSDTESTVPQFSKGDISDSEKKRKVETEKAICVRNQVTIWEKLLEIRIQSQKILNKTNTLPSPTEFSNLLSNNKVKTIADEVIKNEQVLLGQLLEIKLHLSNQFSDIKKFSISGRKRTSNEDTFPCSKKFAPVLQTNFEKFRPYRNSVLLKWEDRTKAQKSFSSLKRSQTNIVQNVESILQLKSDNSVKSNQNKNACPLSGQQQNEISSNVYDDTDFYYSQLRELVEFKSNMLSNASDASIQLTELQKLRKKMQKKIDTRASKGRKIRYIVHNKLVNLMTPHDVSSWSEDTKNELFKSLFVT